MKPIFALWFTVTAFFFGLTGNIRAEDGPQPVAAPMKIKELKVGDPAPALAFKEFVKGKPINHLEKGKVYVLVFGYMACPACRMMYPYLTELQEKYPDIPIVSVHIWESKEDAPRVPTYIKKLGKRLDYRVALDANDAMARNWMVAAGQNGTPSAFIVDGNGKIAWINHPCLMFDGYRGRGLPELGKGKARSQMLEQISSGQWDLQAAAAQFAKKSQLRGATAPETERAAVQAMKELGAEVTQKSVGARVSSVAFLRETKLITDAGLKELKGFRELQSLFIGGTRVTDAGLREIKNLQTLQSLGLGRTQITDTGLKELRQLSQLQMLDLSNTQVTDVGLKELRQLRNLQKLFLNKTKVTDAGMKELRKLESLRTLILSGPNVTNAGMKELKELRGLEVLSLDNTAITDAGLEALQGLDALRTLSCTKTQVTGAGLKGFKGLQELYLNGAAVTDIGLKGLRNLKELKRLVLNHTPITDAGLKELTGLPHLAELYLNDTGVTDAGLQELQGMVGLKRLYVEDSRVTEAGAAKLRKLRPKLLIQVSDS